MSAYGPFISKKRQRCSRTLRARWSSKPTILTGSGSQFITASRQLPITITTSQQPFQERWLLNRRRRDPRATCVILVLVERRGLLDGRRHEHWLFRLWRDVDPRLESPTTYDTCLSNSMHAHSVINAQESQIPVFAPSSSTSAFRSGLPFLWLSFVSDLKTSQLRCSFKQVQVNHDHVLQIYLLRMRRTGSRQGLPCQLQTATAVKVKVNRSSMDIQHWTPISTCDNWTRSFE